MKTMIKGVAASALLLGLTGCSTMSSLESSLGLSSFDRQALCVATGAVVGGAAGSTDDSETAVKGAIGGALVGALVCHLMDGDSDGDGIKDSADKCPGTPIGVTVDGEGCAIAKPVAKIVEPAPAPVVVEPQDLDQDGVVDADDVCPDTPAGSPVDAKGCPPVQKIVLNDVTFEFDSALLTSEANNVLQQQVELLKKHPAIKVSVTGHTDSAGDEQYNQVLSLQRARAVRNFLVDNGIDSLTVTVAGAGEVEPVADNATAEGRSLNRRVEFRVVREGK